MFPFNFRPRLKRIAIRGRHAGLRDSRPPLRCEPLESRLAPVIGAGEFAFAADARTIINNGDNVAGVVEFGDGNCSGSLIDLGPNVDGSRVILTAAHCIRGGEEKQLLVGGTGNYQLQFTNGGQTLTTDKLAIGDDDLTIQNALNKLGNLGTGKILVDGPFDDDDDLDGNPDTKQYFRVFFRYGFTGVNIDDNALSVVNADSSAKTKVVNDSDGYDTTDVAISFYMPRTADLTTSGSQDDLNIQHITYFVDAAGIFVHPQWNGVFGFEGDSSNPLLQPTPDIAIITLPSIAPFGASDYQLYTGDNPDGQSYYLMGYGRIGDGKSDSIRQTQNEFQRVTVSATGGSFTLSLGGGTESVTWDANANTLAANIQTAIQKLPGVTAANVRPVTAGPDAGSFEVEFTGPAKTGFAQLSADGTGLTGTVVVRTIQNALRNALHLATNTVGSRPFGGTQVESSALPAGPAPGIGLVGAGDSGGPDFVDLGGGDLAISGIHSYGADSIGSTSTSVRVAAFASFIQTSASKSPYALTLDMGNQVAGNDGAPDSITVRRVNGTDFEILVNGTRYYRDAAANISSVTLIGSTDDDTFRFEEGLGIPITINGGGFIDKDTLVGNDIANTWTIDGSSAGNLNGSAAVSFSNIENLSGGNLADTFAFKGFGFVFGSVLGNSGADTLDYSGCGFAILTNLQLKTSSSLGKFDGIEALIGSPLGDGLIGEDNANTWTITAPDKGDVDGFTFEAIENIAGGNQDDVFSFRPNSGISNLVVGQDGKDTLDFSAFAAPVTTDLQTMKATPIGGTFSGIEALIGSALRDRLVGEDNDNTWTISGASQGDVDGFTYDAVEDLTGGSMADLFRFQVGGVVGGDIDGRDGFDRLDFSAIGSQQISLTGLGGFNDFDGSTPGTTPIVGFLFNINAATGSAAGATDEVLNLTGLPALWAVTAVNGGTYRDQGSGASFGFDNFEFLTGGSREDTFVLNAGTQITGRIDGGIGDDLLRGQGAVGNDSMILTPGRLTLNTMPTLFGNIEAVRMLGEQGNDRFVVRFDQGNPVPINGSAVVGGAGFDLLTTIGSALRDGMALTPGFLKVNAAAPIFYSTLEQMDLFAGGGNDVFDARYINYQAALAGVRFFGQQGNDTITLAPSATTRFFIHGGPPARPTFPGDALFFVKAGQLILPPVILGNGGSDGLYHFKNRMAVQFASIEEGVGGHLDIQPWNYAVPNIF